MALRLMGKMPMLRIRFEGRQGKGMLKRCIGIDIGRSHVRAAQVVRMPEGLRIEKVFVTQTRRSTDSLPSILQSLTKEHGFDLRADVAVSLPHHAFFFADIETDAAGLERIRTAETTMLKDYFPILADDIVAQVCSVMRVEGGKSSVLVAATSCDQLREELNSLSEGKIKPARIDMPITAAQATVVANHPESATGLAVILYVDEATLGLAVTHDGRLLLVRNIPMFSSGSVETDTVAQQTAEIVAQEIEITWQRLFGSDPDPSLRVFLIAAGGTTALLGSAIQTKTGGQVIPVDPFVSVAPGEGTDADCPLCIAEGLALRTLQPGKADSVDFLAAYRARTRPRFRVTRELAVCAGLAAAAAAVWVIGLFVQLSSLESNYAQLKERTETTFRQAAPEETSVVNPAVQLQQKLDSLRKDCESFTCFNPGHPAPLEILYALSRNTPTTGNLKLQDVLIAADSVRIVGSCDKFGTLSEWRRLLEKIPGLRVVDEPKSQRDAASGKVHFTISLSTAEGKA
ncbi:MAG: hypothetical protein A2Y76_09365 [Planctomycetes bacterium RBG_13_60_9]|nr:MAG: hypothetical protein A2Y76_09365 [Planctomycetes bacterium RBG_13_60_9]